MTRVLVLGAAGMLGHKLYQVLGKAFDVTGTIRGDYKDINRYGLFQPSQIVPHLDAMKVDGLEETIAQTKPDVVINCIGVIKPLVEKVGIPATTWQNARLPHELYRICRAKGARLIHISTDCVFSGSKGNYSEDDSSDADDIYGKTKYQGEVKDAGALTIRTSIIGRELAGANGLLEWFLANRGGRVKGYTNAIFSGFPTLHLAGIIADIISKHQDLNGLFHVASEPISKYSLLTLINDAFRLNITIDKYPDVRVDRSLNGMLFRQKTGFKPLPWEKMIEEIARDKTPYEKWRQDDFPR